MSDQSISDGSIPEGAVPAPGLREVAAIWWDSDEVPTVQWRDGGTVFVLAGAGGDELVLARFDEALDEPREVAGVLAEGLAACDFPPTGERAAPGRVAATLRAAGRAERLGDT